MTPVRIDATLPVPFLSRGNYYTKNKNHKQNIQNLHFVKENWFEKSLNKEIRIMGEQQQIFVISLFVFDHPLEIADVLIEPYLQNSNTQKTLQNHVNIDKKKCLYNKHYICLWEKLKSYSLLF